jgi:phosphoesterase RecJ-like protein
VPLPPELIETLQSADRPLVVGHVNPDADALGSMLALARSLPSRGAAIALSDRLVGGRVRFMLELAGDQPVADAARIAAADVVAVVDTAIEKRVNLPGGWAAIQDKRIVNIDHHITNTDFGAVNWVEAAVGSTSELVHRLIVTAGWLLDAASASLLYAGVYSDTGGFSLPSVTADTMDTAAALVRAGADVGRVGQALRWQQPHEFDLIRTVYANTRTSPDRRVAYSTLSHAEIAAAGCTAEDIDDQVSIPRSLSGIRVAILFSEGEPGVIRVNLRGENGTPILPLAEALGGGGHTFSAGVRIRGDLEAVVQRVLDQAALLPAGPA